MPEHVGVFIPRHWRRRAVAWLLVPRPLEDPALDPCLQRSDSSLGDAKLAAGRAVQPIAARRFAKFGQLSTCN